MATSPGLATFDEEVERRAAANAWDFIGEALYRRFAIYRRRVSDRLRALRRSSDERLISSQPALSRLRCFVFNDAGNAAMQLHIRLSNPSALIRARRLFCLSLRAWNHCAAAHVNLARHAPWANFLPPQDSLDAAIRLAPDWPSARADRLEALYGQYRDKRNGLGDDITARKMDLEEANSERGSLQPARAAIQPALLQNADARTGPDTTQLISDREPAQARIRRLELELKGAQRKRDMLDRQWKRDVCEHLSNLLQRFPLGRVIDRNGALPTDLQRYPISTHLRNPTVDVEMLTSAEQDLLHLTLRALTFLIDQEPEIADDILACCTELRRRLSDESWIWVSLHCDVLELRAEKVPLNGTELAAWRLAWQQRLRIVKAWLDSDPAHTNSLDWLMVLKTNPLPAGEVERAAIGSGFHDLASAATGPMATAAAKRGMTRWLLKFSASQMVDDRTPPEEESAGDHETRPARAMWRELATMARRLGPPGKPALRADWAAWYDAATNVLLDAAKQPSQLRCLRLTAVAAGRAISPAVRAGWWGRCASVAAQALASASGQHTEARVDFARWYAQATARADAIRSGSAEPLLQDVLGDIARQLRAEFFESEPPRDVGVPMVRVLLGKDLVPLVATADGELTAAVQDAIRTQRTELLQRFGIEMPALRFSGPEPSQPPNRWDLLLRNNPVAFGEIDPEAQTTTQHGTDPLSQMMSRITGEFHAVLPVLVGLQEMDRLLDGIESSIARALRAKPRGLPRLLALAHALLALELPLDVAALATLVLNEPSVDFDRLILRARATERARAALMARADQTVMWSVPISLQTRLMAFVDGDGDGRALALWPVDLNALQAVIRGLAPSPDELSIVIDEPLLLSGLTAVVRRSRRRALVLVRDELALHQQFARQSEIADLPMIGEPLSARLQA